MRAKYWMTFLVFSVLPAPDSPLARWGKTCGGREGERARGKEDMQRSRLGFILHANYAVG